MKRLLIFLVLISILIIPAGFFYFSGFRSGNIFIVNKTVDFVGDNIFIIRSRQENKELFVSVFAVESKTEVELPGTYGKYPIYSIYPLLKIDKKSDEFIKFAYFFSIGGLADDMIALDKLPASENLRVKDFLIKLALNHNLRLNLIDRYNLLKMAVRVKAANTKFAKLDANKLDFAESSGECSIAVVNTTEQNGLAKQFARILQDNTFRVVNVSDSQDSFEKSKIFLSKNNEYCKNIGERLYSTLPNHSGVGLDENLFGKYRAELIIFLGNDITSKKEES